MNVQLIQMHAVERCAAAVRALGHEVRVCNYRSEPIPPIYTWPDVVIVQQGDWKDGRCLPADIPKELRKRGIRCVWWTYDPPATKRATYDEFAMAFDELVVCTEDDREFFGGKGADVRVDWVGIDPGYWRPAEPHIHWKEEKCYGATCSIVGHMYPNRQEAIRVLQDAKIDVAVWGTGVPAAALLDTDRVRYVYQSCGVNVILPFEWNDEVDPEYLIMRHFEIPAVGGFAIAKRNRAVRRELPGIPTFDDFGEMVELVKRFAEAPAARFDSAKETRARVLERFTLERFFKDIITPDPRGS